MPDNTAGPRALIPMMNLTRPLLAATLVLTWGATALAQPAPPGAVSANTTPPTTAPATTTAKTFVPPVGADATAQPPAAPPARPGDRPIPAVTHLVIFSIDGCRPDLLLLGDTPVLHAMIARGSYSMWARTTAESITLPSHTSMVTGVQPIRHGIQWNADLPLQHPIYPAYPTLFQLAHHAGYTTAMAAGKSKFVTLDVPGSIDHVYVPDSEKTTNADVAAQAVDMVQRYRPGVLYVHLPGTDNAGHKYGWATPPYMAALHDADTAVGRVLAAVDAAGLAGSTVALVTADHGGAGRMHGPEDARSRHIPWIIAGPGIRRGLDLTTFGDLQIDTEDTFSTACYLLGVPIVKKVEGKPITQILDRAELLK